MSELGSSRDMGGAARSFVGASGIASMRARGGTLAFWPGFVLSSAVFYNAILSLVNASVLPLGQTHVVMTELVILVGAHVIILAKYRSEIRPWYALILFMFLFMIMRTVGTGTLEVKYFRDVLIIPTFIALGMCMPRNEIVRWIVVIHAVVLFFMFYESLLTENYADLFGIREYYINTRGYRIEDFWNTESSLFVSATRPDERIFLPFLNLHRVSSIFLEPVSLGNYCVLITAFICAFARQMSRASLVFLSFGNIMLIVACDGRLAMMSSVLIVFVTTFIVLFPRNIAVLYFPLTILFAMAAVYIGDFPLGGDDLPGRIAHTVDLLHSYGVMEYLGMSSAYLSKAVDSGVAYLIITQSLLGVAIIWAFIVFVAKEDRLPQKRYLHATCIYIVTNMLVSFSFLTIKTASLLWVVYGFLQVETISSKQGADPERSSPLDVKRS